MMRIIIGIILFVLGLWHMEAIAGDCSKQPCQQGNWCYEDSDSDGHAPNSVSFYCSSTTCAGVRFGTECSTEDCSDSDPKQKPGQVWYKDSDNDGYSDGTSLTQCSRPAGYKLASELNSISGDCDDNNAQRYPGNTLNCGDGIDNDCTGVGDEIWAYPDSDGDRYAPSNVSICVNNNMPGYITAGYQKGFGDCNDNDANINPSAPEICADEIDNDCDGKIGQFAYRDIDGDGVPGSAVPNCVEDLSGYVTTLPETLDCNDSFSKNVYSYSIPEWDRLGRDAMYLGAYDAFSEHAINAMLSRYLIYKMGIGWFDETQWDCDGRNQTRRTIDQGIITTEALNIFYAHLMRTQRIFSDGEFLSALFATNGSIWEEIFSDNLTTDFWPQGEDISLQNKKIFLSSYYHIYLGGFNWEIFGESSYYANLILQLYAVTMPWFLSPIFGNNIVKSIGEAHGYKEIKYMQYAVHQSVFAYMGRDNRGHDIITFLDGYGCFQGVLTSPSEQPTFENSYSSPLTMLTCILSENCIAVDSWGNPEETYVTVQCYGWEERENIKSYAFSSTTKPLCRIRKETQNPPLPQECSLIKIE